MRDVPPMKKMTKRLVSGGKSIQDVESKFFQKLKQKLGNWWGEIQNKTTKNIKTKKSHLRFAPELRLPNVMGMKSGLLPRATKRVTFGGGGLAGGAPLPNE